MPSWAARPDRGDAVDDAEIDRLGSAADVGVHALDGHAEHLRRRHGVDVEPVGEGLPQRRDVGHMGEHAQLDLAVVGGDQLVALVGHEGLADGAALGRAHRDVLQIRLERRQPPRGGGRQRIGGVHAPRLRDGCRWAARRYRCFSAWRAGASREPCAAGRGLARQAPRARSRRCPRRRSWCACRLAGSSCRTGSRRAAWASRY